jgi:hypothetical protein
MNRPPLGHLRSTDAAVAASSHPPPVCHGDRRRAARANLEEVLVNLSGLRQRVVHLVSIFLFLSKSINAGSCL